MAKFKVFDPDYIEEGDELLTFNSKSFDDIDTQTVMENVYYNGGIDWMRENRNYYFLIQNIETEEYRKFQFNYELEPRFYGGEVK